jgi:hypothetical protein
MRWKIAAKRAVSPGKFKGVRVTSDAVDVVLTMPKRLLLGKK